MTKQTESLDINKSPYKALLDSIYDNSLQLSYSSLKAFSMSPRHFVEYKLRERTETAAMRNGSLLDCLLTTPNLFESKYIISENTKPSGKGEVVCDAVMGGVELDEAIEIAGYTRKPNKNILSAILDYIEFQKANIDKIIISQSDYDAQYRKKEALYNNASSSWILNQVTHTQIKLEWERYGFKWRGYADMKNDILMCDLKNVANHTPKKVKYTIREMKYDWQAAMYIDACPDQNLDYYIMAIDDNLNVTIMQIEERDLNYARQEIKQTMTEFKRCMFKNDWKASYDFYAKNGIYKYSEI